LFCFIIIGRVRRKGRPDYSLQVSTNFRFPSFVAKTFTAIPPQISVYNRFFFVNSSPIPVIIPSVMLSAKNLDVLLMAMVLYSGYDKLDFKIEFSIALNHFSCIYF
jgi:hypothetical protein